MQDRETALKEQENAREWQAIAYGDHPATWAALAYYRERGWPVDANTFPERDRCENRIFAFKAGYAAALASPLSAPPQKPTGDSPQADVTCEHGTAMDVHCCNCHSGFIFDVNHECPSPELTWREAVEQALGVENDPENHTPSWAFDVVRAAREIGNAPTPASPQAEMTQCDYCHTWRSRPCGEGCCWQPASLAPVEPTPPTLECCACGHLNTPQQATRLEGEWRSSGEYVCLDSDACARRIAECSEPPVEPTPEPETCEWRYSADAEWWQSGCDSQDLSGDERLVGPDEKAKFCPYCGKPLRLVPSEETK